MHDMMGSDFMPHGSCFLWRVDLLSLHVVADAITALSYFCIPVALVVFLRRRKDLPFRTVFWLFCAFILLCGTTHLLSIWVLWNANYYTEGVVKALTALASLGTAIMVVRLLPEASLYPSPAQLRETNARLEELNAQLEVANAKLAELYRESEVRGRVTLGAVVDNVADGVITLDERRCIESVNGAVTTIFGYGAGELLGQDVATLMAPSYRPDNEAAYRRSAALADTDVAGASVREGLGRHKDGTEFPVQVTVSAFTIEGRRYYSSIIRDVTKLKQYEDSRQRLLDRLTESNTELERFAYVASHDMQEPVRMVLNFSQIIAAEYAEKLDDAGREYLSIITESAVRMRDLITDLLDYARLGSEASRQGMVDLSLEFEHVLTNLGPLIRDSRAEIATDKLPTVPGNAVQLMRVMQNLVSNAIKYLPPGQVAKISIGAAEEDDLWHLSISDNGLGIAAPFLEQIFTPFRRLHNWESIKGTGLGLAVCRKIVENHGGRIWAESRPGEGSVFHVTLPKVPKANAT